MVVSACGQTSSASASMFGAAIAAAITSGCSVINGSLRAFQTSVRVWAYVVAA